MKKRVILVIGASSGIGLATAQKLADAGHVVYSGARSVCPDERITSIVMDVSAPKTVEAGVAHIIEETGRIEQLIYCAGCSMAAPVEYAKAEDYRYLFDVNFFGALHAVQAVLPHMRAARYGRIVLIGSMGGVLPIAYDAFYSSIKAALTMFGKALNLEVNPFGIFATTVLPGGTSTRFTFKRKIYPADSVGEYASDLDKSVGSLAGIEQGGMEASDVADTVLKVLNAEKPPQTSAAGLINKTYYVSQKLLPEKLTQHLVQNTYHLQ